MPSEPCWATSSDTRRVTGGSRGRRFKSGRPDWSEYHFELRNRTVSGRWERNALHQFGETAVAWPVGGHNAAARPGPQPAYAIVHPGALVSSQKAAGSHPAIKAGGNTCRGPWRDTAAALADPRPATPSAVSARPFGRSLPPLAGLVQPSLAPRGLNSCPNLGICERAPAAPDVLPVQMPHARGCPEADMHGVTTTGRRSGQLAYSYA